MTVEGLLWALLGMMTHTCQGLGDVVCTRGELFHLKHAHGACDRVRVPSGEKMPVSCEQGA